MDPDANIKRQLEITEELDGLLRGDDADDMNTALALISDLVDLIVGLNDWITRGGGLPKAWKK
jgi:hypothetical protein